MAEGNEFTPAFAPFFGMVSSSNHAAVCKGSLTNVQAGIAFAVCLPLYLDDALH